MPASVLEPAEMFHTVLVANRGEIARRVIRTLRALGIRSVAVYSDPDADAPHVREADASFRVGPAAAAESYLDGGAILAAARESGAQAIHPGYGFLSENAAFAADCAAAGIVFIGPGPKALDVMGDKIRSKAHVAASGVPIVPGIDARELTDAEIADAAADVGYPLLIKPSAGGGGKGMQVVRAPAELPEALATARRVASAAFGDDTLLLERLIERPRHIEVQVIADAHGRVIHLGERECTLQRRHQKVVEEAPSPIIDEQTRASLGVAACAAAASVDYRGAGTVEFLVAADRPQDFFFIEMNTRLQVEHPVTELVTGLDLVELQLRVAAGGHLGLAQHEVRMDGHAIEARVYAESPARGFLPATGTVLEWAPAPQVRTDSAVETGSVVTADYDPMIAKVIAHAPDRAGALALLDRALAQTVLLGVDTNVAFLRTLLADEAVRDGDMDTGLIDRMPPFADPEPSGTALCAAAAATAHAAETPVPPSLGLWQSGTGWRAGGPALPRRCRFATEAGEILAAAAAAALPDARVAVDGDGAVWVHADGVTSRLEPLSRRAALERQLRTSAGLAAASSPELRAPMPGTVVAVHVTGGTRVRAGERIVTIEAMKMEHPVIAPHDGTASIQATVGDQVHRDHVLARVLPDPAQQERNDPWTTT
ncbi:MULTISPECIES: biotin carboxylase N-terminal domain-containing protein [unclassified Microbacterium]|uniref:acetyl/propionyl/methylcrotonyl-CoA carboxylase subunit alpha n=2 Tax=unclassified Microbacterium TaxID=2609290 RepID=UPI002804C15B|nr:biotin carboxylase N-terminal domain-containing protein [Microbacterium sp. zg.B185]